MISFCIIPGSTIVMVSYASKLPEGLNYMNVVPVGISQRVERLVPVVAGWTNICNLGTQG